VTDFPEPRPIALSDLTLSVHEAGSGPAVVLCHGFPELAYSWRHQVPALAGAGFHVLVPDQRGYGASDAPEPIEAYDLEHLCGDLVGLLDAVGIERAVFAGHDWGGFVAWAMAVAHPDRTAGVIGVNTPYVPFPTTDVLRAAFPDDEKLYILWFQKPGVAESVLDRNPRLCFEKLMRRGVPRTGAQRLDEVADANPFRRLEEMEPVGPPLLEPEELDYYARAYAQRGFRGGINWYRNIDRNRRSVPGIGERKLDLPCLMITAEWDLAIPPELAAGMPGVCSDLEMHNLAGCGHWTQQEKPRELNRLMTDWLERRFG
jgi:pimeloyl-ACP methyl ester carboxylesterase